MNCIIACPHNRLIELSNIVKKEEKGILKEKGKSKELAKKKS